MQAPPALHLGGVTMCLAIVRFVRRQQGSVLVEFALLLPLLVLVLFGITEFGRAFAAYLALSHAAREGVRIASLGASDAEIEQLVKSRAAAVDSSKLQVTVTPEESQRLSGSVVSVKVEYVFTVLIRVISDTTGATIPMSTTLSMRVE